MKVAKPDRKTVTPDVYFGRVFDVPNEKPISKTNPACVMVWVVDEDGKNGRPIMLTKGELSKGEQKAEKNKTLLVNSGILAVV